MTAVISNAPELRDRGECAFCGAPIGWVTTMRDHANVPVDPAPHPAGKYALHLDGRKALWLLAPWLPVTFCERFHEKAERYDWPLNLYVGHRLTCGMQGAHTLRSSVRRVFVPVNQHELQREAERVRAKYARPNV